MAANFTSSFTTIAATPPDNVIINRAEYDSSKQELHVRATSSDATAELTVRVTASGELIGKLTNQGDGERRGNLSWPVNPQNITILSSLGGSAKADVELK